MPFNNYQRSTPSTITLRRDEYIFGGEVPSGPPKGSRAFNPRGIIPLPDPADNDVAVLTTTVPLAYDGIILGIAHTYIDPSGSNTFQQGSGDLIWRIKINGIYYARDCGEMLTSLGSLNNLYSISGGILVRSLNTIEYLVYAPNTSGALAGGSIYCSLHGYFFPRM